MTTTIAATAVSTASSVIKKTIGENTRPFLGSTNPSPVLSSLQNRPNLKNPLLSPSIHDISPHRLYNFNPDIYGKLVKFAGLSQTPISIDTMIKVISFF